VEGFDKATFLFQLPDAAKHGSTGRWRTVAVVLLFVLLALTLTVDTAPIVQEEGDVLHSK
jgi:hypothetical protein